MRTRSIWAAPLTISLTLSAPALSSLLSNEAWAQAPAPPQPYYQPTPAPYPQPPPQTPYAPAPPQTYAQPGQATPYPPASQPSYPPGSYPPGSYPPAQSPQPTYVPPAGYGQPPTGYVQPPPVLPPYPALSSGPAALTLRPAQSRYRSSGEMAYLLGAGIVYGVGTGVWIDSIGGLSDPGLAVIAPLVAGAAVPIGLFLWDDADKFDRGVPSSIGTGIVLGGLEGIAISGLQWQLTGNGGPSSWGFPTWTTLTFLAATGGGIGGYAFGEWFQPDPRSLGLIASGAGWGALTGFLFGAGVGADWKDGAAVWGFAGYNAGVLATGLLSTAYVPSWQTLKYMWLGDLLGTLATTPVYLFYIGNSAEPRHGLVANAVGGLAGIALAAALTANMTDAPGTTSWSPPFQIGVGPTPSGGAQLTAFGQF
jgi:hypothetical protein